MDLNLKGVDDAVPSAASWRRELSDADVFTTALAELTATIFQTTLDAVARPAPDAPAQFDAT
jgi:hypothetical protein